LIAESKPDVLFEFHQGIMERLSIDPDELLGVLVGCGLDRFDVYTNNGKIIEKLVDRYQVLKLSEEIQRSGAVNPYLDVLAKAR